MECLQNELDRTVGSSFISRDPDFWRSSIEQQVEGDERTPGKYTMNIPLGQNIEPQDLKVSLKNNIMTVEAHKEKR